MWWQIYLVIHVVLGFFAFGMYRNWLKQLLTQGRELAQMHTNPAMRGMYGRYDFFDAVASIIIFLLGPLGFFLAFAMSAGHKRGVWFRKMPDECF